MPFLIRPTRRVPIQPLMVLTTFLVLMLPTPSHAAVCFPPVVEKDNPYRYVLTLIDSMGNAQTATKRHAQNRSTDTDENLFKMLYGFKLAQADFECAESQLSPYISSTNEAIKTSAEGAAFSFSRLAALQKEAALDLKSALDAGPGKFKYGTALDRQAELTASLDAAWKLLLPTALAATFSVIEEDPKTKLMSRLALAARQRDEILHELRSMFGDEVTKGIKTGQTSLAAAGAMLYEVIGNQPRKTRDNN